MPTQLPSGMWRAQVFVGYDDKGKRRYKSFTAETKEMAQLEALKYTTKLQRDKVNTFTMRKAIDDYIRIKTPVLSPATIRGYDTVRNTLKMHYREILKKRLYEIDTRALQSMVNELSEDLKPKTVKNVYYFIRAVMAYNGFDVEPPTLPRVSRPELSIPDRDTLIRLYEVIRGTELEVPVLLAALGPMRRGEIVAASIKDLSDDNILYVHRSAAEDANGKTIIKEVPKTDESNRYILLPQYVADLIRSQGKVTSLNLRTLSYRFSAILSHNGFEHFRFHDLRHAFVSIAHAAGIPDAYIMARGGWSTTYTMTHVYRHTINEEKKKMDAQINNTMLPVLQVRVASGGNEPANVGNSTSEK